MQVLAKPSKRLSHRIQRLKAHLQQENPLLVDVVGQFQMLDKVGYRMGLLDTDESFANRISWWPLISVLGTFSAGKSTFINGYLGAVLQKTGNQAVDDKFTVMTYSADDEVRVLPGLSLDADPRFPFYQISEEIEKVSAGEGSKIDSYLQLKTCHSDRLKGKILIDSPGFDADAQRNATLRITDHIIDLSDLVLVFFDARHPEPGAMEDTLQHLVSRTLERSDANKFVFILNQIDTTAREDNLEDVVAAWQKAVVQAGMTAGTFYCLFNDEAAVPIEDPNVAQRYKKRRDTDAQELSRRMEEVGVERSYRIIGALENLTNKLEQNWVPQLRSLLGQWRRRVLITDAVVFGLLALLVLGVGFTTDIFQTISSQPAWIALSLLAVVVLAVLAVHYLIRKWWAKLTLRKLKKIAAEPGILSAFIKNVRFRHSLFRPRPVGWGGGARRRLEKVREAADDFVQALNDRFTDPSGKAMSLNQAVSESAVVTESEREEPAIEKQA
ncbi:MAG TPA: dynamin family protein [Chromatiales bacterium]|nr:dynamin family protein [Thiotrichales bacterium]HIP68561.1 dynamin family protein [Chromatiales bacterium]